MGIGIESLKKNKFKKTTCKRIYAGERLHNCSKIVICLRKRYAATEIRKMPQTGACQNMLRCRQRTR